MMHTVGSYITKGVKAVSAPFHLFDGAVDIIVVEQQDGSFKSSPWYVRFGKFQGVLKAKEKEVTISVDGVRADFHMYLDRKGEAYFLREETEGQSTDAENTLESSKATVRRKTPTPEQLASLNLKEGKNFVSFTFSTSKQVYARIYLWKWNTRIVISDVDGTITKSDVQGHFMHLVGMDWSQTGVAHLFSSIKENGYQLLFLSSRAISHAYHTRGFLSNLVQDGKALPEGPVIISPDGHLTCFSREVIRAAHEFKIPCLEDIKALFPSDPNPFYAGFGNKDTDERCYLEVGIPQGKIFIINSKGKVVVNGRVESYTSLGTHVHRMFPAMSSSV